MLKSFFFLSCNFFLGFLISSSVLAQAPVKNQSKIDFHNNQAQFQIKSKNTGHEYLIQISLYTTNFTEPLSYQGSAFLKLPKFP